MNLEVVNYIDSNIFYFPRRWWENELRGTSGTFTFIPGWNIGSEGDTVFYEGQRRGSCDVLPLSGRGAPWEWHKQSDFIIKQLPAD